VEPNAHPDRSADRAVDHSADRSAGAAAGPATGGVALEVAAVVDELALVRAGIAVTLRGIGIEEIVETHAAREAVRLVAMEGCGLVVVGAPADLPLADAARRLAGLRPAPRVVALVPPAAHHLVGYLVALGVGAIVLRTARVEELATGLESALKGVPHVAPGLLGALSGSVRPAVGGIEDPMLSPREREVLVLLAEGRSNREIASAMAVTVATVKTHLVHIYAKLGAGNRNEALGRALSFGLLA
jgi:DNA-binding NarL/FixJ family response regulator